MPLVIRFALLAQGVQRQQNWCGTRLGRLNYFQIVDGNIYRESSRPGRRNNGQPSRHKAEKIFTLEQVVGLFIRIRGRTVIGLFVNFFVGPARRAKDSQARPD